MNDCSYNIIEVEIMNKFNMPNEETITKMCKMLSIASDQTRMKILFSLLGEPEEKCVSEIVVDVNASQSLISHHLKLLKNFDLVATRRDGKKIYYSLKDDHVRQLVSVALEHAEE